MNEVEDIQNPEHSWFHERLAAYVAGGLAGEELQRFEEHLQACAACFDAFAEGRDADLGLQRALSGLAARGDLERKVIRHFREKTMTVGRLMVRRAGYAAAAAVALAATGVFANFAIHRESVLNNALTERLAGESAAAAPGLDVAGSVAKWWEKGAEARTLAAANLRGIGQSTAVHARDNSDFSPALAATIAKDQEQISTAARSGTMLFNFNHWPASAVASQVAQTFGYKLDMPLDLPGTVSLTSRGEKLDERQSVSMLRDVLYPLGYSAKIVGDNSGKEVLQVAAMAKAKNSQLPVFRGSDASEIPENDALRTQVIPVRNINAASLRREISPFLSSDADVATSNDSNSIVVTDTSANIHRLAEIIHAMDSRGQTTPRGKVVQGISGKGLASGSVGAAQTELAAGDHAKEDYRINEQGRSANLVVNKADKVKQLEQDAARLAEASQFKDSAELLRQAAVIDPQDENARLMLRLVENKINDRAYEDLVHRRDEQTMRQNLASAEHLIPHKDLLVYPDNWMELNGRENKSQVADLTRKNSDLNRPVSGSHGEIDTKDLASEKAVQRLQGQIASGGNGAQSSVNGQQVFADRKGLPGDVSAVASTDGPGLGRSVAGDQNATDQATTPTSSIHALLPTLNLGHEEHLATAPAPSTEAAAGEVSALKIIRNGTVEFEVRSFDDASATVAAVTSEERGFVASTSSERLANGKMRGTIVLRVPPERLDRLLLKLRGIGELKSQQIGSSDVSKQYTDIESELRGLRTMEGRLLDLIKNGKGEVKDLVEAEKQLGEYRVRIEKLEGEIRYYNNLVALATLTVTAYEKDIQKPTAAFEQESVNLAIETEEVETKYAGARRIFGEAGGRIVESQLKNTDAEHIAATITAEVPPEKAEFVTAQLRQLGRVANFTRDRRQTTSGGPGAPPPNLQVEQKDARISISLFNLANLAPRETTNLTLAVRDVDASYRAIVAILQQAAAGPAATMPGAGGGAGGGAPGEQGARPAARVIATNLAGQEPEQMSADIRAELRSEQADGLLRAIREAAAKGNGELLTSTVVQNADAASTTSAKRGLQLRIVNIAGVPARESQNLRLVAQDVGASYGKLLTALQALAAAGNARVISSHLAQSDPRTVTANLAFEARREALPAVEKAFAEAGVDFLGRTINRAPASSNALDSKVSFQVEEFKSAEALDPRRTYSMTVQVENVEKAVEALRSSMGQEERKGGGNGPREVDFSVSRSTSGDSVAQLVLESPEGETGSLLERVRGLGTPRSDQITQNTQVPETRFAKDRLQVTLVSREAIVSADKGLGSTLRAALSSAAAALLYSAYLVLTGLLFLAPFALVLYPVWRMVKKRRTA